MKAAFTPEQGQEFQRRADAVCAAMRAAGLRQLVLTDTDNLFYLTGATFDALERPFFLILDADGGRQLVVPALELDHLGKAWGAQDRVTTYREYPAPAGETWHDALLGKGLLQPGFAFEPSLPMSMARVLQDAGGEPHELMEGIRIIKSAWEIAAIERAIEPGPATSMITSAPRPPVSSRTIMMSRPLTTSSFSVEASARAG